MIHLHPVDMDSTTITDSELDAANPSNGTETTTTTNDDTRNNSDSTTTATATLDRPRSRYSRLYSEENSNNYCNNNSNNSSTSKYDNNDASTLTSKPHRSSYRERAAAAAAAKQQSNTLTNSSSATSVLSHSSSNGDVPTATFTLRSTRTSKTAARSTTEDNGDSDSLCLSRQNSRTNLKMNGSTNTSTYTNNIENDLKELKLSNSSNGLYKDNSSNSITTTITLPLHTKTTLSASNSNGHLSALTPSTSGSDLLKPNHSANNLDISDNATTTTINELQAANNVVAGGAEVYSSSFAKTLDTPIAAKKIRSTALRSIPPPPPSPTSSRYWDRDSRTTPSALNNFDDTSKFKSNDENSEGLCGLRNIGNTCFMNSVIQCLSNTSELTKFLKQYNGTRSSSSKDQQILQEFAKLIREMWSSNVHSVTPMDLKRAFSLKHRMYSDYNQQDAQEFLRFFLDSLHSALNTGVKGEHLKIDDNLSDNKKADLTWEWYSRHENSLIRDLFVGQLKSTLRCTSCGNTSVTFDPFWDLSVSLPSSSRCKLESCLDLFIREEVLDGDEMPTCSKCRQRRRCTKSFSIQRFPKYLVIHLKRFSETRWSKLSNIVEFPTSERELNMGPYGSNPNMNIYYSLYAISNHMGSTAGGHYVALCKHPVSRKWHEFNDNIVSDTLSENNLVSSSAYILFYERA
ncbi:ubiquitin carboxyl-terminal hydrolase Usp2 isoform X4 [Eurosta solidaginis]|uniref:ubiquitin carboxyl-terminal hydrolase Usp2 isoform X4 n=1 Tax=Eurosta solidaginis TaxID=178769 RepID=UPI0035317A80